MEAPYDETFEEFERRTGLDNFFGNYSTEVRGKLLSKNLEKPTDVYDILYPRTRQDLLSKNVPIKSDLDKASQEIRDSLLVKFIENQKSLEESGIATRNQLLAKNKLVSSSKNLEDLGEEYRKKSLSKNDFIKNSIDSIADVARRQNISNNESNSKDLLNISESNRDLALSRNVTKDNDPFNKVKEIDDESYLRDNLVKNKSKNSNLEVYSKEFRDNNESKNRNVDNDLLEESDLNRKSLLLKNVEKDSDLELDSKSYRLAGQSKNETNSENIDSFAQSAREESVKRNINNSSDLDVESNQYRNDSLSKNKSVVQDLDLTSVDSRNSNLSKNEKNIENLEISSKDYRDNSLSKNISNPNNLDNTSPIFRQDSLSKNNTNSEDLENISSAYRESSLSKNEKNNTNLEEISSDFRKEDLKSNAPKNIDLESFSSNFRDDDLSNNNPISTDLEVLSGPFRQDDLSFNTPIFTNLENDSQPFLNNNISNNQPNSSDLETDSQNFLNNNLSNNSNIDSNLEFDSVPFRNDDLSSNVQINSDLESDSTSIRNNNLSNNVEINSDLENDSLPYLGSNINSNVPNSGNLEVDSIVYFQSNISSNVSNPFDLGAESITFRNNNLNSNVSNSLDLFDVSQGERNEQTSYNVSNQTDLNNLSNIFRNEQLAKNESRFTLGTNIILAGTSQFIGISNLEIQGAVFRETNKILNRNKKGLENVFDDDESIRFFNEIAEKAMTPGGKDILLQKNSPNSLKIIEGKGNIVDIYGARLIDGTSGTDDGLKEFYNPKSVGYITNLISLHNIQQNTFQARPGISFQSGSQSAIEDLRGWTSEGFQELISKTGIQKRLQRRTNTTPEDIINANNGQYLSNSAEKIIRTVQPDEEIGTGVSMAAQTDTTDSIAIDFERNGKRSRGVRHVIDTIKEDERISFAQNFNVQGTKESPSIFILGKESDGKYKKSYNRFTIKNPYAPDTAQHLKFTLTNYSMNGARRVMAFPAYIKNFQNGDSASWNSTTFLGRPEPIYTYGSSSRDGSVSFYVLTDFASNVDIGYSFNPDTGDVIKVVEDFSGISFAQRKAVSSSNAKSLNATIRTIETELQNEDLSEQEANDFRSQLDTLRKQQENSQRATMSNLQNEFYSENDAEGTNIYKMMAGYQENTIEEGYIETKAEDTVKKLAEMKSRLLFQPGYFSGSKADFLERMEFIAKLTRPARNSVSEKIGSGFSFSKPPVCHIHLGDWFNHDIIINSVSYDYSDAPWTLDGGKQQPMWCNVTINFNIIGSYGALGGEDPPLSTDRGGFFSWRTSK
jgi:hypothetical protein